MTSFSALGFSIDVPKDVIILLPKSKIIHIISYSNFKVLFLQGCDDGLVVSKATLDSEGRGFYSPPIIFCMKN